MLFGSKAPLWRYILGIVALSVVAQRIGVAMMVNLSNGPPVLLAAYAVQAFGALVAAAGLFGVNNALVYVGLGVTVVGIVVSAFVAGTADPTMGFSVVGFLLIVGALLALVRRAALDDRRPRAEVNRHALTAEEAENFAAQKLDLFGGHEPEDVHVTRRSGGGWHVTLLGSQHDVDPMTEMEWQSWLEAHA